VKKTIDPKVNESSGISGNSGQAIVEYVLLMAIVVYFFSIVIGGLKNMEFSNMMVNPVKKEFASAYCYGHPKAIGFDENGGPYMHPRAPGATRMFINPGTR